MNYIVVIRDKFTTKVVGCHKNMNRASYFGISSLESGFQEIKFFTCYSSNAFSISVHVDKLLLFFTEVLLYVVMK